MLPNIPPPRIQGGAHNPPPSYLRSRKTLIRPFQGHGQRIRPIGKLDDHPCGYAHTCDLAPPPPRFLAHGPDLPSWPTFPGVGDGSPIVIRRGAANGWRGTGPRMRSITASCRRGRSPGSVPAREPQPDLKPRVGAYLSG